MSDLLFAQVTYPLAKLVQDIAVGEIGLPDIQRPFIWQNAKVRDLFDSMYRGFPVGYLLFWKTGEAGARQIGTEGKQKTPDVLIVDGQQRLTSLYAVLRGINVLREDYREERIRIAFKPVTEEFTVTNAAVRRDREYIPDISVLWLSETKMSKFRKDFLTSLRKSREVDDDEEERIDQAINKLVDLGNYPFSVLELSSSVDEEQVAEVFVRINSKGEPLDQADFILTLMSVFNDAGRTELEAFCRSTRQPSLHEASPFNYLIQPKPDQMLRPIVALGFRRARLQFVYSILRGKDLETGIFSAERRDIQFETLRGAQKYTLDVQRWHEFLKAISRAGYRAENAVTSQNGLLYTYALFLIGSRDFHVHHHVLRKVIARWFFMSSLMGRYTNSPETRMEQDLADMRTIRNPDDFTALLNRRIDEVLTEDFWTITLPNDLTTSASRSPSLFAYYAALQLLDARVLFSQLKVAELLDPALKAKKAAVERHHLFPKAYLAKQGITSERETNQIANYALVEWADNVSISDDAPAEYYPKYASELTHSGVSPEDLYKMQYWHALPEGWYEMPYQQFLVQRRQYIARVIRAGFNMLSE